MNAADWRRVARPIVWDLAAVLEEHRTVEFSPRDLGPLYTRLRQAADRRDRLLGGRG